MKGRNKGKKERKISWCHSGGCCERFDDTVTQKKNWANKSVAIAVFGPLGQKIDFYSLGRGRGPFSNSTGTGRTSSANQTRKPLDHQSLLL